jgi:predicted  nucleic acid-binding Zn-ribbon protein
MKFETARLIQLQTLDAETHQNGTSPSVGDIERRGKIIQAMPPELVSRYERLKGRYQRPVVRLVGGVCEGCRVKLAASVAYRLRSDGSLQVCDHCGRFIYFDGE